MEHLIPLYEIYDHIRDIKIETLPDQFVFKPNHSCGCVILCHNKYEMNWIDEADKMELWLRENYYYRLGEWGYKNISPKIMCEKLLQGEIIDYKFFCFSGKPILVRGISDRANGHYHSTWWDLDFNIISSDLEGIQLPKPKHWDEMIKIAGKLSEDFPFVRVDLYDIEGKVYFGELTFTPNNGMDQDIPDGWDKKMGALFDLKAYDPKFIIHK